jgi:hypothetical protein
VIRSGILIIEYVRSTRREAAKEVERKAEVIQIQNDLRDLYHETAKQDAQIRELVRILNLSMPDVNYTPKESNATIIPLYHKEEHREEKHKGVWATMDKWVWNALDFIVPHGDDLEVNAGKSDVVTQSSPGAIKLEVVKSSPGSSSTSSQNANSNNLSNPTGSSSQGFKTTNNNEHELRVEAPKR